MSGIPPIHLVRLPEAWPTPPASMTHSTFEEIQACPRRWALSRASYPELWNRAGYPARLNPAALPGTVVHASMDRILRAFATAGVESPDQPAAVAVLRELGGLTAILSAALEAELLGWMANPRSQAQVEPARRTALSRLPAMRMQLQTLLSRIGPLPIKPVTARGGTVDGQGVLAAGVYPEVWLEHSELGWKGKADLVLVSDSGATLMDFKTGDPKPEHARQLQIYGLLWTRDDRRNPSGRAPERLLLCYANGTREVPALTSAELESLEARLAADGDVIRSALAQVPPPARPNTDSCFYCPVRHLCDSYWRPETLRSLAAESGDSKRPLDVEVQLVRPQDGRHWNVQVHDNPNLAGENIAILRLQRPLDWLESGMKLRLLSVSMPRESQGDADGREFSAQITVFTQTAWTELYTF